MATESICLITMLGACACEDILWKRIHVLLILLGAVTGVLLHMVYGRLSILDVIGGFAVGTALLAISILSQGRVGLADAMMIMTTGIYLGFIRNLELLWLSSTLTGIVGLLFLLKKKISGDSAFHRIRIPFAPAVLTVVSLSLILSKGKLV